MLGIQTKQPADQEDYDIDFSRWLPPGDIVTTIAAVVDPVWDAIANPNGVQILSTQVAVDGQTVKVWVNGGETGKSYKVTATASTAGGRVKEVDFQIRVKDC